MKKFYILFFVFFSFTLLGCYKDKTDVPTNDGTGQTITESGKANNSTENQILKKTKIQEIMNEIKTNLGEGAGEIKSDEFEWRDANSNTIKVKGFSILDTSFDNELESFFRDWKWSVNNLADGPEESLYGQQKDDIVCLIHNYFTTNLNTVEQTSTKVSCGQIQNAKIPQTNTQNLPKSDDLTANTLIINAFGEEPFWNIILNGDNLKFLSSNSERKYIGTTLKQGNGFIYNGNGETGNIKVIIKDEKCIDNSIGNEHRYKINLVINGNINREGCGDLGNNTTNPNKKIKSLYEDPFFSLEKTGPINELEKKINLEIDDDVSRYTIKEFSENYLLVEIAFPDGGGVMMIFKNTDTGWIELAGFQDISDDFCEEINQKHNEIIDWDIFYYCPKG